MSTAAHHLERSRRYLRLSRANAAADQHHRAADALRRSVTHAATAVMAAEGRPTRTRRRLYRSLSHLVFSGSIPHAHLQTFRRVHDLPASLHSAARPTPAACSGLFALASADCSNPSPAPFPTSPPWPKSWPMPTPAPQPSLRSAYYLRNPRRHPGPLQRAPSGLQRPPRRPDPLRPRPLPQLRRSAHPREHPKPHPQPTSPRPRPLHGLVHRPVAGATHRPQNSASRCAIINL